jgi:hypothetical protein
MTRFQFFIALFCAEWLVIFRTWLAPSVLLTLVVIAGCRLYAMSFIPHWMGAEAVIGVAGMAFFIHLRSWGRHAHYRDMYKTPDTGVPWLLMATQTPKGAMALEVVIAMAVIWFYFPQTPFRLPPGPWENPGIIGGMAAFVSVAGLTLWNAILNRRLRQGSQQEYMPVQAQSRKGPRLPSVQELAEQFQKED